MNDILLPLRKLHGNLKEKEIDYRNRRRLKHYLKTPNGSKIYILGIPEHVNVGDSAIVLAETLFLERHGFARECIKEITKEDFLCSKRGILKCMRSTRTCFVALHGGGNLGDTWLNEEYHRRYVLNKLPEKKVVIFPQTIYFSDSEQGRTEKALSIQYYNKSNMTIVAREKQSYDILMQLYPNATILLTPDIVLSTKMEDYGVVSEERAGVLFCTRSDKEKMVDDSVWDAIRENLLNLKVAIRQTDMYSDCSVTKENRKECVRKKMQEFCGTELAITDRLHGMVFAAITGTPCIVFSNYNQKVKGTYDWISYLPYIRYVETVEEAIDAIPELLEMKNCTFDNTPLMKYYNNLAEVVKERCRK